MFFTLYVPQARMVANLNFPCVKDFSDVLYHIGMALRSLMQAMVTGGYPHLYDAVSVYLNQL